VGGEVRESTTGGLAQKEQDIDIQHTPRESNAPPDVCGPRGGPVLWNMECECASTTVGSEWNKQNITNRFYGRANAYGGVGDVRSNR